MFLESIGPGAEQDNTTQRRPPVGRTPESSWATQPTTYQTGGLSAPYPARMYQARQRTQVRSPRRQWLAPCTSTHDTTVLALPIGAYVISKKWFASSHHVCRQPSPET
ncbi:hypothetical protein RSK60_1030002 [Ralstonia solanacearum K60]|nr:hypothetical protein RSK60_1030002 [Ralstonia solanacearum K60]